MKCRKTDQEDTVQTQAEEITYAEPAFHKRKAQNSDNKEEDQVEDQVENQVEDQVEIQVKDQVKDRVEDQVEYAPVAIRR
ncbi:superkiller protein 3-like [Megalobrama amblycephala]|uniref:superkiller protein 3-like n=1 Tax=Megalobrama amblycephala TaxID=75352 RepID=UPI002013E002|nr:superkiller protein 3-like [Megalobrama amblycephala]